VSPLLVTVDEPLASRGRNGFAVFISAATAPVDAASIIS
jgi:hypothetical protein